MNLAWKEMRFYKFRYALIMLIIFLLGIMVLFISGLAQGLARENISFLDNTNARYFITEDMKEPKIESSHLTTKQQSQIEDVIHQQPTSIGPQTLKLQNQDQDVLTYTTSSKLQPKLEKGSYPQKSDEIAINQKLTGEDIKVGDKVSFKGHHQQFKVSGIIEDTMYAHSSMILMTKKGFNQLNQQVSTFYPVTDLDKQQLEKINSLKDVKVSTQPTLTDNIASYKAEQLPLNLMIASLFIITAIVLSAFFYVMTIQKVSQIGILKAIGIKTRHLLSTLVLQILMTTLIGVFLAVLLIEVLQLVMPVSMPFYLNNTNIVIMIAIFLIVGFIGTILSFFKILRIDPIEAIGGGE
ncbi:ABC transporter permease [Staphylococcus pragensis]|uniref:Putative hemin transport system permease protein HrtB n=1 Tax=Staphylococcus pragensis TaxID=1611836 RepID=A0A4Z1BB27_9STAP|nr:ABC transporter permease [Staphylococcus pragensis]RTX90117.1 ABC transporter permease [Staphylococcus carnosus]TGN27558.1 ABC transporter permease [Staphylococcus pragensis]GGG91770.1 putative hemin transport system permease protein HrtB [Staphylococcus pragensis]